MKKITLICAVLATLLAVSCGKDVKPAAPMTSSEIQEKMSTVAVNVLNEVDPDNWKEFGQTGLNLIYVRPWEKNQPPVRQFNVMVIVKDGTEDDQKRAPVMRRNSKGELVPDRKRSLLE